MPSVGSILRSYNAVLDHFAGRDGPRSAGAGPPGRRDRRARTSARSCARPLRDPDDRAGRVRRRDRRAQHRLVGGVGHVRVVHQPLRRARRRRSARRSPGPGTRRRRTRGSARSRRSTASCWRCRRGWCATFASTSRWARFHGYDLDFCLQVRDAGRKVVTADFRAIHHRPLEMVPDPEDVGRRSREGGRASGTGRWASAPAPAAGRSAPDAPRPTPTRRSMLAYMNALESDARVQRARARPGRDDAEHLLADHGPLRWLARVHRAFPTAPRQPGESLRGPGEPPRGSGPRRMASHAQVRAVIAFGTAISGAEAYRRYGQPGVDLAAEPDSEMYAFASVELDRTHATT